MNSILISLALFVAGCIFTLLVSRSYSRRTILCYWIDSEEIFSRKTLNSADGFDIKFRDAEVAQVKRHVVYIWNGGNAPLWESNFASANPLRIEFDNNSNVFVDDVELSSQDFELSVNLEDGKVVPTIVSMDSEQGFRLTILESVGSEPEELTDPLLAGSVVGLSIPPKKFAPPSIKTVSSDARFGVGCLGIALIPFAIGIYSIWPPSWPMNLEWKAALFILAYVAFIALSDAISGFIGISRYRVPASFNRQARRTVMLPVIGKSKGSK